MSDAVWIVLLIVVVGGAVGAKYGYRWYQEQQRANAPKEEEKPYDPYSRRLEYDGPEVWCTKGHSMQRYTVWRAYGTLQQKKRDTKAQCHDCARWLAHDAEIFFCKSKEEIGYRDHFRYCKYCAKKHMGDEFVPERDGPEDKRMSCVICHMHATVLFVFICCI